jgi:hypothetical protein
MVYYEAEPSQTVLDEALSFVQRAVNLDDQEAFCHLAVARVRLARREYALALIACEAAVTNIQCSEQLRASRSPCSAMVPTQ